MALFLPIFVATEALYVPLTISIVASTLGLIACIYNYGLMFWFWLGILSLAFPLFWYTRPEGVWIIPSCLFFALMLISKVFRNKHYGGCYRVVLIFLIPFIITMAGGYVIKRINKAY